MKHLQGTQKHHVEHLAAIDEPIRNSKFDDNTPQHPERICNKPTHKEGNGKHHKQRLTHAVVL